MSYDIALLVDGKAAEVAAHEEGGTYALGGLPEARLNITYNYSGLYRLAAKAIGWNILTKEFRKEDRDALAVMDLLVQVYDFEKHGLSALNGKTATETIAMLRAIEECLGTKEWSDNYWAPTAGNAGVAVQILAGWAEQYPEGRWEVT